MQQVADRRLAVFRALEARHIRLCSIIDRFDRAIADRDPNQHRGDRLCHRLRDEPIAIGPSILVMLTEDLVVLGDQQACNRVA